MEPGVSLEEAKYVFRDTIGRYYQLGNRSDRVALIVLGEGFTSY